MAAQKKQVFDHAAVIVANDLKSGLTVFLDAQKSWVSSFDRAQIITNQQDAAKLLELVDEQARQGLVLDPYLVGIDASGHPVHIREKIRFSVAELPGGAFDGVGAREMLQGSSGLGVVANV